MGELSRVDRACSLGSRGLCDGIMGYASSNEPLVTQLKYFSLVQWHYNLVSGPKWNTWVNLHVVAYENWSERGP